MKQLIKEKIKSGEYDKQVLSLIGHGYTNKEVCKKTGLSIYALRCLMNHMYVKYQEPRKIPLILKVLFNK